MKSYLRAPISAVYSIGLAAAIIAGTPHAQGAPDPVTEVLALSAVAQKQDALVKFAVPVEHSVSLPLPTLRCQTPGFASFASPALRVPKQPMEQGVPDRWWVVDAKGGQLLLYATTKAIPFGEDKAWETQTLESRFSTIAEAQKARHVVEQLVDELAPLFFTHQQASAEKRTALVEALRAYISPELMPQYQALASDFFNWLQNKSSANGSSS